MELAATLVITALATLLLIAISILLRRMMQPLRQIEAEIGEIEQGERSALSAELPTELAGVARNLNLLIDTERGRSDRYRKTLDNLAHSLKTPLAAMRALFTDSGIDGDQQRRFDEQIERMDEIVRYQLRKPASLETEALVLSTVDLVGETVRLVEGLTKVYASKGVTIEKHLDESASLKGDTGDYLEMAGNLLDNACKWCESRVRVSLAAASGGSGMVLSVEDDGPGIPAEARDGLLKRGARLDEATPGHGIGLAIVKDIVASFGGELLIEDSTLGGARIRIRIPA